MSTLRSLPAFVFMLLLAACGGGGGGVPSGGNGGGGDPPPGGVDETTRSILEQCLPGGLADAQGVLADLQQLLTGGGSAAGFSILPGSLLIGEQVVEMIVSYDADGDTMADAEGPLRVLSDEGAPANPFDPSLTDMLGSMGVAAFDTVFAALPDGYQVAYELNGPTAPAQGGVTWIYGSGSPVSCSGTMLSLDDPCGVSLGWEDQGWSGLLTGFPTAVFTLGITRDEDLLDGTLTADGSRTALVDVARNDGALTAWTFDLQTGEAEPR